jgi:acetolactate synthase I/II/III large subunit
MNGSKKIIETLIQNKTEHIFGFPGGGIMPVYDELLNYNKLRHILVRHEQAAAHAADAYARIKNKPGVCLTTSGPGATNIVTGLMSAFMDSIPLVALSGNVPTSLLGKNSFQETDMINITKVITKKNFQVKNPSKIESTINNSFKIAMNGKKGPVFIDIPKDIQLSNASKQIKIKFVEEKFIINKKNILIASKKIINAERPVIIAGGGVISSLACEELRKLSNLLLIPVTTTLMGKGCFDDHNPLSLGVIGMHGKKVANYAVANADLIISIGCRFSDRIIGNNKSFAQNAEIIQIDINKKEFKKNVGMSVGLVGDAKIVLNELIKNINFRKQKNIIWNKKIQQFIKECDCDININSKIIDPRKIIFELNRIIKKDDIVTTGTGQHQMFAMHFLKRSIPNTFITSGGSGTMGFGFPASIGAKIAVPKKEVFNIDGDGSFAMNIQELATCKEEQIKTTQLIFNNAYLGMVRQWQELFMDKRYSHTHLKRTPDFSKVAQAYNLNGLTIERSSEIKEALQQSIKNDETTILNFIIQEESNILPMFASNAHHTEMFGNCINGKGIRFV